MDEQIKLALQWAAEQAALNTAATVEMLLRLEYELETLEQQDAWKTQEDARY